MKKLWHWLISSAVAGIIGIMGLILAVYTGFFYERKPELSVSVDTLSKVFDLYRPVGGLEVSYAGENLRSSKKNLWVLTATVKNVGNAEIRKGDYDEKAPLSLEIGGAVIAERPVLKTNVDYLSKNLIASSTETRVTFSSVILEAGDSFEVTVLLLGSESAKPTVSPIGKLAGIQSIALITPETPSKDKSVWYQAVEATSFWVHPIRAFIYFFGAIFSLVLVGFVVVTVTSPFEWNRSRKDAAERQKRIREYRQHEELSREARFLLDQYGADGAEGLATVAKYMSSYARQRSLIETLTGKMDEREIEGIVRSTVPISRLETTFEAKLKTAQLVEGKGLDLKVSERLQDTLNDLCSFLKIDINKLLRKKYPFMFEAEIASVEALPSNTA